MDFRAVQDVGKSEQPLISLPVTPKVAGSSPVAPAILSRLKTTSIPFTGRKRRSNRGRLRAPDFAGDRRFLPLLRRGSGESPSRTSRATPLDQAAAPASP